MSLRFVGVAQRQLEALAAVGGAKKLGQPQQPSYFMACRRIGKKGPRIGTCPVLRVEAGGAPGAEAGDYPVGDCAAAVQLDRQLEAPRPHLREEGSYRPLIRYAFRQSWIAGELDESVEI